MQQLLQRVMSWMELLSRPVAWRCRFRWSRPSAGLSPYSTRVTGVVTVVDEALSNGSVVADPAALEAQRVADPSPDHLSEINSLFDDQLGAADLVLMSRADCLMRSRSKPCKAA